MESQAFNKFTQTLQIPREVMFTIISTSFGYCKSSEFPQFLNSLKIIGHIELPIAKSIMNICKGYNCQYAHDEFEP